MTITPGELLMPIADLPKDLAKLRDARDKAWEAYTDHETDNYELLQDDWLVHAEAQDIRNAVDAVAKGEDPPASVVDAMRAARPMAIATLRKLQHDVRTAESAFCAAYKAAAIGMEAQARQALTDAAGRAEVAWHDFQAATAAVGKAAGDVRHLRDRANGGQSDAMTGTTPVLANGNMPAGYLSPVAQLRQVVASYAEPFDVVKRVRVSTAGGGEIVLTEDRAQALVGGNRNPLVKILGPAE